MLCASAGVVFVAVASVLVVRAYLSAQTDDVTNPFAPMTYTNTDIYEPTDEYTVAPTSSASFNKSIQVCNNAGEDKKPVFARVALVATVYDANGLNVTTDYPDVKVTPPTNCNSEYWTKGTDGYYYYNYILYPGDYSYRLFTASQNFSVSGISNFYSLPVGGKIDVAVILDTVQAVETDSALWYEPSPAFSKQPATDAWGSTAAGYLQTIRKNTAPVQPSSP